MIINKYSCEFGQLNSVHCIALTELSILVSNSLTFEKLDFRCNPLVLGHKVVKFADNSKTAVAYDFRFDI